jgi:cytochrome c-type biogenesis protein CcmH
VNNVARALVLWVAFSMNAAFAVGIAPDVAADPVLEARVNQLAAELRCLVCQNQSLADSHAELAVQLKDQVREQLRAGRNQQEVIDYMTERYGDFVRYRPPLKTSTLLLWAGPALMVAIGIAALGCNLRRPNETAALSEHDTARAAAMLER